MRKIESLTISSVRHPVNEIFQPPKCAVCSKICEIFFHHVMCVWKQEIGLQFLIDLRDRENCWNIRWSIVHYPDKLERLVLVSLRRTILKEPNKLVDLQKTAAVKH